MEKENIRASALEWFRLKYGIEDEVIFASKFYYPSESWSNSRVWFFQIPYNLLDPMTHRFFHFLCENHLQGDKFIYLKVPVSFLLLNEQKLDVDKKQSVIRIYLSAEAVDMFREVRKGSKLDFSKYVLNQV